jgi:hypothetical protein
MTGTVRWTPPPWSVRIPVCILIMLLQAYDAMATLYFTSRGAQELNPLAEYLLSGGHAYFLLMKSVGVGLLALVVAAGMSIARLSAGWKRFFWISLIVAVAVYATMALVHTIALVLTSPRL